MTGKLNAIIVALFSFGLMSTNLYSQKIVSHKWQNRLLLIIADDTSNVNFQKQITHLTKNKKNLVERKLLIYKIFPNQHIKGLKNNEIVSSNHLYKKYNPKSVSFKVVLIGLDGSVKLKQTEIITVEKLNGIIDAMPMRIKELQNRKDE